MPASHGHRHERGLHREAAPIPSATDPFQYSRSRGSPGFGKWIVGSFGELQGRLAAEIVDRTLEQLLLAQSHPPARRLVGVDQLTGHGVGQEHRLAGRVGDGFEPNDVHRGTGGLGRGLRRGAGGL